MLWSTTREEGASPEKVRETYKGITTKFRNHGVNELLAGAPRELKGRALVSMIAKFDRAPCEALAHRLADAILKEGSGKWKGRRESVKGKILDSTDPIARLKAALEATKQDIGAITVRHGESLAAHARRSGNKKTYEVLCKLTD
jgi:hypothetical protein